MEAPSWRLRFAAKVPQTSRLTLPTRRISFRTIDGLLNGTIVETGSRNSLRHAQNGSAESRCPGTVIANFYGEKQNDHTHANRRGARRESNHDLGEFWREAATLNRSIEETG
jgi:hypothetical protein